MHNWNTQKLLLKAHSDTHILRRRALLTCESLLSPLISFSKSDPCHHSYRLTKISAALLCLLLCQTCSLSLFYFFLNILFWFIFWGLLIWIFFLMFLFTIWIDLTITVSTPLFQSPSWTFSQIKKHAKTARQDNAKGFWDEECTCALCVFLYCFHIL